MSTLPPTGARPPRARNEALALLAGKVVANASLVALAVVSARVLGAHARGVIVIVTTLTVLTSLVGSLGVSTAFRVSFLRGDSTLSASAFLGLAPVLLALQIALCTAAATVVLPHAGYEPTPGHFLLVGGLGTSMLAAVLAYDLLMAVGKPATLACIEAAGSALPVVLFLAFDALGVASTRLVIFSLALGFASSAIAAFAIAYRSLRARPAIDVAEWERLLAAGRSPLGQTLAQFGLNRADRLIIAFFASSREVGIYSVAAACSELVRLLPIAAGQIVLQRVAAGHASASRAARIALALTAAAAAALVLIAAAAPTFVTTVFGEEYRESADVIRVIAFAEIAMTAYLLGSQILLGAQRARHGAIAAAIGCVLVLGLDVLLIPGDGIIGAAWASLVGYWVMAVLVGVGVWRLTRAESP